MKTMIKTKYKFHTDVLGLELFYYKTKKGEYQAIGLGLESLVDEIYIKISK